MPFLRQKEFLTERRLLFSSIAGNRPSSILIMSPWERGREVQFEWLPTLINKHGCRIDQICIMYIYNVKVACFSILGGYLWCACYMNTFQAAKKYSPYYFMPNFVICQIPAHPSALPYPPKCVQTVAASFRTASHSALQNSITHSNMWVYRHIQLAMRHPERVASFALWMIF